MRRFFSSTSACGRPVSSAMRRATRLRRNAGDRAVQVTPPGRVALADWLPDAAPAATP